jgi:hypothetical protein
LLVDRKRVPWLIKERKSKEKKQRSKFDGGKRSTGCEEVISIDKDDLDKASRCFLALNLVSCLSLTHLENSPMSELQGHNWVSHVLTVTSSDSR